MNVLNCPTHGPQEITAVLKHNVHRLACGHRVLVMPDDGGIVIVDPSHETWEA